MAGLTLLMSKSFPGSTPISFSLRSASASSAAGGLSFMSIASRLKNVPASMASTWSGGILERSTVLSTGTFVGGVYGLPHWVNGVSL